MTQFDENTIWALIPAAGKGSRMRQDMPKQYRLIDGWPVILHTLDRLAKHPRIAGFTICLAEDDCCWASMPAALDKPLNTCIGGETRAESVLNGLRAMHNAGEDTGYVLVHDAVRPCVAQSCIDSLIEAGTNDEHGALLALPISDNVKQVVDGSSTRVSQTIARQGAWLAQTPQLFKADLLRQALQHAIDHGVDVYDESSAMEAAGYQPQLVHGSPANFKLTFESDLKLARHLLETS